MGHLRMHAWLCTGFSIVPKAAFKAWVGALEGKRRVSSKCPSLVQDQEKGVDGRNKRQTCLPQPNEGLSLALLLFPAVCWLVAGGPLRPEPMDLLRDSSFLHVFVLFLKSFDYYSRK